MHKSTDNPNGPEKALSNFIKQYCLTNSSTLLDTVLTSHPERLSASGIQHVGISDHDIIFVVRKFNDMGANKFETNNYYSDDTLEGYRAFHGTIILKDQAQVLCCSMLISLPAHIFFFRVVYFHKIIITQFLTMHLQLNYIKHQTVF